MRWLAITVAFLAATAGLIGGIYLRDRVGNPRLPHQQAVAHREAEALLDALAGSHCSPCGVAILRRSQSGHWLAQITTPQSVECVDINLITFTWQQGRGFRGVTSVNCATARSDARLSN